MNENDQINLIVKNLMDLNNTNKKIFDLFLKT